MARLGLSVGMFLVACSTTAPEVLESCDDAPDFAPQTLLVYRVKGGESLSEIAQRFRVKSKTLSSINHLTNPDQIRAGAGLLLPKNSPWTDALPAYQAESIVSAERRLCESKEWSAVSAMKLPVFAREECGAKIADCSVGGEQRVCFCEGADDGSAGTFVWLDQEALKASWPATPMNAFNTSGGQRVFSVRQLDLDQDMRDEVVVFAFEAASNGVPIDTSRVAILSGGPSPLLFADDGSMDNLLVVGARGCEIQTTTWSDYTPQLEAAGLYRKRESYVYQAGALSASATFPVIFQRFGGQLWKSWPQHPERVGQVSSRFGVVEDISTKEDLYALYETTLRVRFDNGEAQDFVYHAGLTGSEFDSDWRGAISSIGDASVVFPYEYRPADIAQWKGRAVELAVMSRDESFMHALWFQ